MVDNPKEDPIIQSIATINGNNGQISLLKDIIILTYQYQSSNVLTKITTSDIINVSRVGGFVMKDRLIQSPKTITKFSNSRDKSKMIIYSVTPRFKRQHQLDILSTVINFDNEQTCDEWNSLIRQIIDNEECRPKSLTVFINPIGGFKRGVRLYNDKISPIFELAGIKSNVTITKHRGEAEEYILKQKTFDVDGLVCVGGDGMLMELVQGLLLKARNDSGYSENDHGFGSKEFPAQLRVGIIPAGSTDTVAYSTTGTKDALTASLNVVLGRSIGIDALSVHCGNTFVRYNVSLLGYGFYGSLIAKSESLRWMGPRRYDWLGFKNFLSLEVYYGELTYLPVSNKYGKPGDGIYCTENCSRCDEDTSLSQKSNELRVTVRDRFVAINSFLISCRCTKSPIGPAPYAHLGNGFSDLIIVRECSRLKFLQHLLRCASYDDHFDFDFVETVRVSEFSFTELPIDSSSAIPDTNEHLTNELIPWNCDGEPIYCPSVHCKVHKQIIKLFASGISSAGEIIRPMRPLANNN